LHAISEYLAAEATIKLYAINWKSGENHEHGERMITKKRKKLEAKDVLPNINRTQATERAKMSFLSLVTLTINL